MSAGQILGALRLAWGTALLGAPLRCISLVPGAPAGVPDDAVTVARVLGGRHVLQGLAEIAAWPSLRRLGAAADILHAATGVALAATDRRWRSVARADAALATGFAVAGLAAR
jgi:hypothetical protein